MNKSVHYRIKILIEETNDAFSSCNGCVNADYAEFATLALSEFKHVLRTPCLTRRQLTKMLRSGMLKHKDIDPEGCWSTFMAHYVTQTANKNTPVTNTGRGTVTNH